LEIAGIIQNLWRFLESDYTIRHIDTQKQMKLPNQYLLLIFAWLVMSSSTAQAALVYASDVVDSAAIHFLPAGSESSIDDVTGAPSYDSLEGVRLSEDADIAPSSASYLTVAMKNTAAGISGVSGTLWVFSNDDETADGFVADERFDLWVSINNEANYIFVETFYNDNAAIDISTYGTVTHVKLLGKASDILCQTGVTTCITPYTNAMEVLAISGIEVTAVPTPAAVWLFGSGLLGLVATGRRRKK
jgi:hypothetical protein